MADLRREIAERVRAQEEQARLQTSLRRSETMAAMGSLVAGVAHEVRNPLFGLSSVLDAMDARFADRQEYRRYTGVLREEVDRLNDLMRELLEYGKPTSGDLAPGPLEEVVADAVRVCAPMAEQSRVEIANRALGGFAPVRMDRTRLVQVFQNLLENAIQHSPDGGTVTVEAREVRRNGRVWLECAVKDAGPGLAAEDLQRMFEPFFTRRRAGTGLGLSIVQRIVEEHGGEVTAGNGPRGGAVLTVTLPYASP